MLEYSSLLLKQQQERKIFLKAELTICESCRFFFPGLFCFYDLKPHLNNKQYFSGSFVCQSFKDQCGHSDPGKGALEEQESVTVINKCALKNMLVTTLHQVGKRLDGEMCWTLKMFLWDLSINS